VQSTQAVGDLTAHTQAPVVDLRGVTIDGSSNSSNSSGASMPSASVPSRPVMPAARADADVSAAPPPPAVAAPPAVPRPSVQRAGSAVRVDRVPPTGGSFTSRTPLAGSAVASTASVKCARACACRILTRRIRSGGDANWAENERRAMLAQGVDVNCVCAHCDSHVSAGVCAG
jgi:hypothetical protein